MANAITILRILCALAMLPIEVLSVPFYVIYVVAGISDMIDGTVARRLGKESDFGARLDTSADMAFVAVCGVKLLPVIQLESWMWIWIAVIAVIKVINIISGYVMKKCFVSVHSVMNKVTGAMLFVLPFAVGTNVFEYYFVLVGAVATFAAVQEGHYIRSV